MEPGQRRRLKKLADDYKASGIFSPGQISLAVYDQARRLTNPHLITRDELNRFLREEGLPEI